MKKPTIPPVTTSDPTVTRALASIKEAIELREGDRGDPKDAFVSFRDLLDGDIAALAGAGLSPDDIFAQLGRSRNSTRLKVQRIEALGAPPAAPLNLTTSIDGFTSILLSWEGTDYENHSYTEIWRNSTDDRSTAVQVGSAPGTLFSDAVLYDETYYYWVRFVNIYNLRSGYNDLSGVLGRTNQKISEVIAAQQDELIASAFATSFLNTVNSTFEQATEPTTKSDGRALVAGDLWVDTTNDVTKRYNGTAFVVVDIASSAVVDSKITEQVGVCMFQPIDVTVDGVTTTPSPYIVTGETTKSGCEAANKPWITGTYSWDNTGAIAQTLDVVTSSVGANTATISTQTSSINGLEGQYILKVATNNAVAGFGLAVDASDTSEFFILADKFGIINSSDDALTTATAPFIVATEVDDDGNSITKTYINSAVIKAADIETLVADGITAQRITVVDEFTAWRAAIGTLEADLIQDSAGRFTLDMNNGFISVTDADGVLRVKLGKLSV